MLRSWLSVRSLLLTEIFIWLLLPVPFLLMVVPTPFPQRKDILYLGNNSGGFQVKNKVQV